MTDHVDRIEIDCAGPLNATIQPPGSKSITNRALICAAMARGNSTLRGALDSEDTRVMIDSLRRLGIPVGADWQKHSVIVSGCGGDVDVKDAELFVGNSGTTIRFLVAMLATCHGRFRLDGVSRMRQRPIGDLLEALTQLGCDVRSEPGNSCPPVVVHGSGLRGGTAAIRGDISSQFLSGILMAAPYADSDVLLNVQGELVSQPYVHMTLGVMSAFGVRVDTSSLTHFGIAAPQRYRGRTFDIEPDASAASYFWGAAAVAGGTVSVTGLNQRSLQGDVAFCERLQQMGCSVTYGSDEISVTGGPLRGIETNMNAISDTVQTLAAVALFAEGPTTIIGVGHIRHKETDRIGDLGRELRKFGASVEELPDGLRIIPGPYQGAEIETYNDHRMAMSLALVGLKIPGVIIRNPACTVKTYPQFFADLNKVCKS